MAFTDLFVLPAGTVLVPISELPENVRREIQAEGDDFAISRPNSRAQAKIIDPKTATLVRYFEKPQTIAEAVAHYSRDKHEDPEQLLEEAFPILQSLITAQLLVAAASQEAREAKPAFYGCQAAHSDAGLREVKKAVLKKVGLSGPLLTGPVLSAPSTSVNYGAAGIAYALYRMACAGEDAELLALADAWAGRAVRQIPDEGAFYDEGIGITKETVGETSLYHSAAGVYAVQALVAQASGNAPLQQLATSAFIEASSKDSDKLDVTLGRAGTILGSAFLLRAAEASLSPEMQTIGRLRSFGRESAAKLWQTMEGFGAIRESKELSNLGIAHGWAGLLYSILCWSAVSHDPLPAKIGGLLQQLGECAEPVGRGLRWPRDLTPRVNQQGDYMPGWCHGTAGYVFLWRLAHKMLGDPGYLALAEGAAWNTWETAEPIGNLCCGMAGQAYALLNFYRLTGENVWLSRARDVARYAVVAQEESSNQPGYEQFAFRTESLYKGELGIAVLAADLERPEQACMPLFEIEGE
jgi:serine/threonine-protein kinase